MSCPWLNQKCLCTVLYMVYPINNKGSVDEQEVKIKWNGQRKGLAQTEEYGGGTKGNIYA